MRIYDNCLIQAPDGVSLSRCSLKKAKWYINKGMADLIGDNPITIRLRFEPSGRRGLDDPLTIEGKPNFCVVCCTTENLTRHHIVPYSFIRHMSIDCKMDVMKDIYPLCRPCHDKYEKKSQEKRQEISKKIGIPLTGLTNENFFELRSVVTASSALLKEFHKLPDPRKEELKNIIRNYLQKEDFTESELKRLSFLKPEDHKNYVNFSKHVANNVKNYDEFAKEWRDHFIETMKPQHMPAAWKIGLKKFFR